MIFIPSKFQFKKWTLPSKASYIALILGIPLAIIIFAFQWYCGPSKENQEAAELDRQSKHEKEISVLNKIEDYVSKETEQNKKKLIDQYPLGFFTFGVLGAGEPFIKGFVPEGVEVNWNTGKLIGVTPNTLMLILPNIKIKIEASMSLNGCMTILQRKKGLVQKTGYKVNDVSLAASLISNEEPFIIAIGFLRRN